METWTTTLMALQERNAAKVQKAVGELHRLRQAEPQDISRRTALFGLSAVMAAPFVIRHGPLRPER